MIERETIVYLIAAKPQAPPSRPPIQPPANADDSGGRVVLFILVFLVGLFFGMGIVASNRPLPPPGNPGPYVEGSGPNLPGHASNQTPPTRSGTPAPPLTTK